MAGDKGLADEFASIRALVDVILKKTISRRRRKKAHRQTAIYKLAIDLQSKVASLERRIRPQPEANEAEFSSAQSNNRTPLPTERRTRREEEEQDTDQDGTNQEEHDTDKDKEHGLLENLLDGQRVDPEDTSAVSSPPYGPESTSAVSSPSTPKTEGYPTLILERDQLGDRMPETLYNLSRTGFQKASAPWIREESLDPDIKSLLVPEDNPDVKFNIFETRKDGGMHVYKDNPEEGREFEWPRFDEESEPPTEAQALDDLERFISNPPDKQVPYYNGVMKSTLYDLCPLYPGKTLDEIDPSILTHVNQTYTHLGGRGSATPMHKEDGNLCSANVCFIGAKLWTKVAMTDNDKFENWVRANNPNCKPCPQFVRHLSIFFAPSQLKAARIAFTTFIQYRGEVVTTKPGEYHQVSNILTSLAISINYLAPSETPSFFDENQPLEVCDECGLKPLYGKEGFHVIWVDSDTPAPGSVDSDDAAATGLKRSAPRLANIKKRRRTAYGKKNWAPAVSVRKSQRTAANLSSNENDGSEEAQGQQATLSKMEGHDERGRFVAPLPLDATMADMVCRLGLAIVSRDAVKQFARAVQHSRRPPDDYKRRPLDELELEDGDPNCISMARRNKQINATEEKTDFNRISNRYDHLQLANCSQALRGELGLARLPSGTIEEICRMSGSTKQKFQDRNKLGNAWRRLCGDLPHGAGLLAYLPCCRIDQSPFGITEKQYRALTDDKNGLERFHRLLDIEYVKSLCAAAEAWYEAMDKGEQFGSDEGGDGIDWDHLEEGEIVEQLQRLTARREE